MLNWQADKDIISQFVDSKLFSFSHFNLFNLANGPEILMMSCKVYKWNKYSWQQERNFVITNHHIYNFNKKSKFKAFL